MKEKAAAAAPEAVLDPAESAKVAHLRYVSDATPGIQRRRRGKGFSYIAPDGSPVRDPASLKRIKSLVIPPAWTDVWICPLANGHLQASGRDARGRKQSIYHSRWREVRDETKYERMTAFAEALPAIRERIEQDLGLPGLPREKILATIVRLMETTLIRVGNAEYARQNKSFGLTTMRNRHVEVQGSSITFSFQGKSRVHHTVNLHDRRLAGIVRRCVDIPGYELFQYIDGDGERHSVDSADVNDYLHAISNGQYFTAKDFRTWAGSVLASQLLAELEPFSSATEAKRNLVQAVKSVAARLGNTPSVCRKCYIHPAVVEAYLAGRFSKPAKHEGEKDSAEAVQEIRDEERALLALLQKSLTEADALLQQAS